MDANEVKEKPEEAIARTGMELYELGTRDTGQGEAELDRLLTHLMGLVEDAKTDAAAAKVPTVEDLTAALARGDLVAKARANAKGFAITFHDRAGVEKVTVAPHVDHVPSVPTTLEGAKKGEVTLQAALVQIVEESIAYAKGDSCFSVRFSRTTSSRSCARRLRRRSSRTRRWTGSSRG